MRPLVSPHRRAAAGAQRAQARSCHPRSCAHRADHRSCAHRRAGAHRAQARSCHPRRRARARHHASNHPRTRTHTCHRSCAHRADRHSTALVAVAVAVAPVAATLDGALALATTRALIMLIVAVSTARLVAVAVAVTTVAATLVGVLALSSEEDNESSSSEPRGPSHTCCPARARAVPPPPSLRLGGVSSGVGGESGRRRA